MTTYPGALSIMEKTKRASLEGAMDLSGVSEDRLRVIFKGFNRLMMLIWRLGLGRWGNGTKYGGYVMVIKHTGRKSGLTRYTPVNYAEVNGDVYCTAAFGEKADWYRNLCEQPEVELWLPDGRWAGTAEDVTEAENRGDLLRKVIVASGFAGPLFGVNPRHLSDQDFDELAGKYRMIKIDKTEPLTGPGGPGDLAWIWPLATFLFGWLLLRRRRKSDAGDAV
jgi:deazaflavin-dependent oxidoreductase (nitroreductase family)